MPAKPALHAEQGSEIPLQGCRSPRRYRDPCAASLPARRKSLEYCREYRRSGTGCCGAGQSARDTTPASPRVLRDSLRPTSASNPRMPQRFRGQESKQGPNRTQRTPFFDQRKPRAQVRDPSGRQSIGTAMRPPTLRLRTAWVQTERSVPAPLQSWRAQCRQCGSACRQPRDCQPGRDPECSQETDVATSRAGACRDCVGDVANKFRRTQTCVQVPSPVAVAVRNPCNNPAARLVATSVSWLHSG